MNSSECLLASSNCDIYEILMLCQYLLWALWLEMYKTRDLTRLTRGKQATKCNFVYSLAEVEPRNLKKEKKTNISAG